MTKYSIISPVKNEKGRIEITIESVVNQDLLPEEWIIIDDYSTDGTDLILKTAACNYSWIKVVRPPNKDILDYSSRVVYLFNFGFSKIKPGIEYICKLDGDVSFKPSFFKNQLRIFDQNPKLGIASGHLTIMNIPEKLPRSEFICTRGAAKIYRISCLKEIGGIVNYQGWDTLDNVAARAKNWVVMILPEYFEHLKEEGSKVGNLYFTNYRTGLYNGALPYNFLYFILKALSKTFQKPYFIGTFLQIVGYFKGKYFLTNRPYQQYVIDRLHFEQKETLKNLFSF